MAGNSLSNKRIFRRLNAREKTVALLFLAAILLGSLVPRWFTVAISDSLDHRVFFLSVVDTSAIKTGDYLVFQGERPQYSKPMLNRNLDRYIKQVGCSPGERLRRDDNEFFCNEKCLVGVLEQDSQGHPLPRFDYAGVVPEKSYFMIGSNPRSYDSRYFGFIRADQILHKALPIW